MKISSNAVGDSNDANSSPHKLLLTNTQVSKHRKAFARSFTANIKLSKTQLNKIGRSGGVLGRLLGPLLKAGLPLIGNVVKQLAKTVLIPLGLTASASAIDAYIYKKNVWIGYDHTDNLKWRNECYDENSYITSIIWFVNKQQFIAKQLKMKQK